VKISTFLREILILIDTSKNTYSRYFWTVVKKKKMTLENHECCTFLKKRVRKRVREMK